MDAPEGFRHLDGPARKEGVSSALKQRRIGSLTHLADPIHRSVHARS